MLKSGRRVTREFPKGYPNLLDYWKSWENRKNLQVARLGCPADNSKLRSTIKLVDGYAIRSLFSRRWLPNLSAEHSQSLCTYLRWKSPMPESDLRPDVIPCSCSYTILNQPAVLIVSIHVLISVAYSGYWFPCFNGIDVFLPHSSRVLVASYPYFSIFLVDWDELDSCISRL